MEYFKACTAGLEMFWLLVEHGGMVVSVSVRCVRFQDLGVQELWELDFALGV